MAIKDFFNSTKDFFSSTADEVGRRTGINDIIDGFSADLDPDKPGKQYDYDAILRGLRTLKGGPRDTGFYDDPLRDKWIATNSSYSGTDVVPIIRIKGSIFTLGNVQTISVSTFREKEPVRVLGRTYVKGYTGGPRTIAGSITFTLFNRDPFWDILRYIKEETKVPTDKYYTPLGDQVPPVDLILWFSNEYGRKSLQTLYGIEFVQEGQVHSVNDIYSEKTVQYVARHMDIMIDHDDIEEFRNLLYERQLTGQFVDNYLISMIDYKRSLEKQISDCDAIIHRIRMERGKRGMVSFGVLAFVGTKDLKDEYNKQLRKKQGLIRELDAVNRAIAQWSKMIAGENDYFNNGTVMTNDDLRQNPNVGVQTSYWDLHYNLYDKMDTAQVRSEEDMLKTKYSKGNVTVDEDNISVRSAK